MHQKCGHQEREGSERGKGCTWFALTGTPVENHLGELWSIFDYLMPGSVCLWEISTMYEILIVKDRDERAAANLRRLIGPFPLRRLKCDVLKELPEKIERVVYSAFEGEQKKLYGATVLRLRQELEAGGELPGKIQILAGLTRLSPDLLCDPPSVMKKLARVSRQSWKPVLASALRGGCGRAQGSAFPVCLHIPDYKEEA